MSGRRVRVLAVERDRVERGRQPLRRQAARDVVEAPVGALRAAFAGEHARRILALALEREDAGGERELAGRRSRCSIQRSRSPQSSVLGQRDLRDLQVRERLGRRVGCSMTLVAHLVLVASARDSALDGRGPRLRAARGSRDPAALERLAVLSDQVAMSRLRSAQLGRGTGRDGSPIAESLCRRRSRAAPSMAPRELVQRRAPAPPARRRSRRSFAMLSAISAR